MDDCVDLGDSVEKTEEKVDKDEQGTQNNESDVLELDCGATDEIDSTSAEIKAETKAEIKAENKAETVETGTTSVREEEDALAASRVLWISGLDRTMKANDFRVAFSPFGKGTAIVQSAYLRV